MQTIKMQMTLRLRNGYIGVLGSHVLYESDFFSLNNEYNSIFYDGLGFMISISTKNWKNGSFTGRKLKSLK